MVRVQNALRDKRPSDAVGLYRAARDIWPADDTFGQRNIDPESEFMELRQIFFTDLSSVCETILFYIYY